MLSAGAEQTIAAEMGLTRSSFEALADVSYHPSDMAAAVSSGSFQTLGMVVVPCSMKTLTVIMPPVPAFYHQPKSIDDLLAQTAGKVLDQFAIGHTLFRRWDGTSPAPDHEGAAVGA